MKKRVVVVADLGNFKAYRLDDNQFNSSPRLELVEEFETVAGHEKMIDQLSDEPGRFPKSAGMPGISGDMSAGERHNIELEQRRRLVKQLAESLSKVIQREQAEGCYFAASREINNQILDELAPNVRDRIERNIPLDLTKSDKTAILRHFDLHN